MSLFFLPGSIILFSSLSHLHTEGLALNTPVNASTLSVVRRFNSMFKGKTTTLPIAPTPLCGIPDPDSVRSLFDFTLWLDSTPNQAIRDCISSSVPKDPVLLTILAGSFCLSPLMTFPKNALRDRDTLIFRVRFPCFLPLLSLL